MIKYPRIVIDLKKFRHNAENIKKLCQDQGIDVYPVMKGVGCDRRLLEIIAELGFKVVADSRIQNLMKAQDLPMEKMLLRLPMLSAADEVVQFADISMNSELITIKALNEVAKKQNKKHKIILMVELGDLREGVLPRDVDAMVGEIVSLENIVLHGVAVNLTCYGCVIPDENNLGELCAIADRIKEKFGISMAVISGGNSSAIPLLLNHTLPKKVNVLRLGEAILLGTEAVEGTTIPGQYTDIFTLETELIELKDKDTVPTGQKGYDAFGKPYEPPVDKGIRRRGIIAMGRQDMILESIIPVDEKISIIGGSSDHTILDLEDVKNEYKIGDIVRFNMYYTSMMYTMTSPYIPKYYVE